MIFFWDCRVTWPYLSQNGCFSEKFWIKSGQLIAFFSLMYYFALNIIINLCVIWINRNYWNSLYFQNWSWNPNRTLMVLLVLCIPWWSLLQKYKTPWHIVSDSYVSLCEEGTIALLTFWLVDPNLIDQSELSPLVGGRDNLMSATLCHRVLYFCRRLYHGMVLRNNKIINAVFYTENLTSAACWKKWQFFFEKIDKSFEKLDKSFEKLDKNFEKLDKNFESRH